MITNWFNYVIDTFVVVAYVLALFEGAKLLATKGVTRKAVVTLFIGVVACAILVSINYFKFQAVTKILSQIENSGDLKVPPRDQWGTSLSPNQKEEITLALASNEYQRHGRLTNFIDQNNVSKLFSPSQKEMNEREDHLVQMTQLRLLADDRRQDTNLLSLWALFSALFGYVYGWSLKRASK
jgi:hypothetical protein